MVRLQHKQCESRIKIIYIQRAMKDLICLLLWFIKKFKNIVNKNFGNLKIFDKEIPTFNKKINVNTGDLVAFPSYYFHQTVRTNSKVFRETINVDMLLN